MNLLRTKQTYATYGNAEAGLVRALAKVGLTLNDVRYLIGTTQDGRFAPVLVGEKYLPFAVNGGITVVG